MKQPLIILTGPTAVGKTALSIRLAKEVGAEIISADSSEGKSCNVFSRGRCIDRSAYDAGESLCVSSWKTYDHLYE